MEESKPGITVILGELMREMRALKDEVSRTYGDKALIATTFCGDITSVMVIGISPNRDRGCNLCCPAVRDRFLRELDPDQGSQPPGIL